MYDVAGLGSALMDFTFEVDDALLGELGFVKGNMHLIDEEKSRMLLDRLSGFPMIQTPGGSAANTAAGISLLGGSAVFMGKVGGDAIGDSYGRESERTGLSVRLARAARMTGHAITLITPDSERTFATHLGAATAFGAEDVSAEDIRNSRILHIEGYMLEGDLKAASIHAMKIAKECGARISIDLADPALVARNLADLKEIMREYADIIYANEDEAAAFTGKKGEDSAEELSRYCTIAVVKFGEKGSLIRSEGRNFSIPSYKVKAVNTNGAGDMYAAGVLYGISHGMPIERAGRIGSYAASLVVAQVGARLPGKLSVDQMGI